MKLALEIVTGFLAYFTGSAIFLRVWCARFGKTFNNYKIYYNGYSNTKTLHCILNGYHLCGWGTSIDTEKYGNSFSLSTAMLISFFFWWLATIIIIIREIGLFIGRTGASLYSLILPKNVTQIEEPLDKYMLVANVEVDQITGNTQ